MKRGRRIGKLAATAALVVAVSAPVAGGAASREKKGAGPAQEKVAASAPVSAQAKAPALVLVDVIGGRAGEKLLSSPVALALDEKNGDLLVASFESGEVVVLDKSGAVVKRMGVESGIAAPSGVAVDAGGNIVVAELNSGELKIFSSVGSLVDRIDLSALVRRKVAPGRIMIGRDGVLYIADLQQDEVLVLSAKGELLRTLKGGDLLQKGGPAGDGRLVSVSAGGTAVQFFTADGARLASFGRHGDDSERSFSFPSGFAVDGRGRIWIADAFRHRLTVWSREGNFLFTFGGPEQKPGDGGLFFPVDLCFGPGGTLYLLEKGASRLQVYQVSDLKD